MKSAVLLGLAAFVLAARLAAAPIDLREKSESGSKQFIVYSEDVRLRQRVASFAAEVKADVLQFLGESDFWKAPIIITLARAAESDRGAPPATLRLAETQPGFKIELQIKIGTDPTDVHLHRQLLRVILLEYAYRGSGIAAGQAVVDPPWWIVEGLYGLARRREAGTDSALFQRLVETNKLPPIEHFLAKKPDELGPTALAVDRALAMCLLELLVEQPGGRVDLARLLRDWPQSDGDPAALLARHFPALGKGPTLQKWWTLSLARFAAADRYQGLTVADTEKELGPLLQMELVINKEGEKKKFTIAEFEQFLKIPASRAVLQTRQTELVKLSSQANALYRPVLSEYAEIFSLLARGKARGLRQRLEKVEEDRRLLLNRMTQIADYLNWFEATKMKTSSGAFDNYLKLANELAEQERKQKGQIGQYLDEFEKEF